MDAPTALTTERERRFEAALAALAPSGRIGIAVSGGPDSLALLLLAHAVRPAGLSAATVDHGLRPEAADEAAMVADLCARHGVAHATLKVEVADDPAGPQAAARMARYEALTAWAVREGMICVATAHHADDQAETLLMRLARGAGLAGLAGVRRSRPLAPGIRLIRPLLDWRKTELEQVVTGAGWVAARDPSNFNPRYDRTRARALLAHGWPDAGRVSATADHLAEAEDALAWSAERLVEERLRSTPYGIEIDANELPRELRRRLLLHGLMSLQPHMSPRGDSIDRLLAALDHRRIATLSGLRCEPGPPWAITYAPPRRSR